MRTSYAVTWREDTVPTCTGKLELGPAELRFEGASPGGRTSVETVPYDRIASVWIARGLEDRVRGRPILMLERQGGGLIRIASVGGLGAIRELADSLETLASHAGST